MRKGKRVRHATFPLIRFPCPPPSPTTAEEHELIGAYLSQIAEWIEEEKLRVAKCTVFEMSQIGEAHELIQVRWNLDLDSASSAVAVRASSYLTTPTTCTNPTAHQSGKSVGKIVLTTGSASPWPAQMAM